MSKESKIRDNIKKAQEDFMKKVPLGLEDNLKMLEGQADKATRSNIISFNRSINKLKNSAKK